MADVSTDVYKLDSMVNGQYIYKWVWTPLADKVHKCIMQEGSKCDKYTVNDQL